MVAKMGNLYCCYLIFVQAMANLQSSAYLHGSKPSTQGDKHLLRGLYK